MKILVCIKQVPESNKVEVDPVTGVLKRDGAASKMNPYDLYALETAFRIREEVGGSVHVISMGPPQATYMLRECLAMGADEAYLLSDRVFGGADTCATSTTIAAGIRKVDELGKVDIIFAGRQAIDGDTAQVGPQIAEKLHLPQITYAADVKKEGDTLTVKRMLEDGYMTIKAQTPCLITCIKELNTPRYMSVSGVFECYSKPMTVLDYNALKDHPLIDATTIGLKGSPTNILTSFTPPQKGAGQMLEGNDMATCEKLAGILLEKHII